MNECTCATHEWLTFRVWASTCADVFTKPRFISATACNSGLEITSAIMLFAGDDGGSGGRLLGVAGSPWPLFGDGVGEGELGSTGARGSIIDTSRISSIAGVISRGDSVIGSIFVEDLAGAALLVVTDGCRLL